MEHLITNYIRQEWEQNNGSFWDSLVLEMVSLVRVRYYHCFRKYQVKLIDSGRVDAVILDFAKAFDVVPHDKLVHKLVQSGIDTIVEVCIDELLRG